MKHLPIVILVIGVIGLAFLPSKPAPRFTNGKSVQSQPPARPIATATHH